MDKRTSRNIVRSKLIPSSLITLPIVPNVILNSSLLTNKPSTLQTNKLHKCLFLIYLRVPI